MDRRSIRSKNDRCALLVYRVPAEAPYYMMPFTLVGQYIKKGQPLTGLNLYRSIAAILDDEYFTIGSSDQCNETEEQGGRRLGDVIDKAFTVVIAHAVITDAGYMQTHTKVGSV